VQQIKLFRHLLVHYKHSTFYCIFQSEFTSCHQKRHVLCTSASEVTTLWRYTNLFIIIIIIIITIYLPVLIWGCQLMWVDVYKICKKVCLCVYH